MKKYFNKLLALVISTVIILTFSAVPAFASGSDPTTWTYTSETAYETRRTISARNIYDSNVKVTAYQIVKGTYKDGKLTGYTLCDGLSSIRDIDDFDYVSPTSDWITKIANYIDENPTALDSVQMVKSGSNTSPVYTSTVEAGEYIILVRKLDTIAQNSDIYNPGVVSVNVNDANNIGTSSSGGTLYMGSSFSAGDTAYMKYSSHPAMRKEIKVNTSDNYANSITASFGDIVDFKIYNMQIPSYSEDYGPVGEFTLQYKITDNLNANNLPNSPFLGVNGLTVKVGTTTNGVFTGSELPEVTGEGAEAVRNYNLTCYDENGNKIQNPTAENLTQAVKYEIEFTDAFIRANGMKNVEVTYSSTFTENAQLAFQKYYGNIGNNCTEATVHYSNDPTNENSYSEVAYSEGTTYTFTFGIDAVGDGMQTYELNKVTQALGANDSYKSDTTNGISTMKSDYALAGATFTIYSDAEMTQEISTSTSDANGHIEFRGLAAGTYYLKETAAPSNYTLNENNYKIVISTNKSSRYTITTYLMGETDTQIGSARYNGSFNSRTGTYQIPQSGVTVTPAEVVNTQLATLPTTGGIGTIVISVVAGLGMAVFLTIFVISKKRSSKKTKIKS